SNEAACAAGGGGAGRTPGQFHRDFAIVKGGILHDRVGFTIGHLALFRDLHRPLALIVDGLEFHLMGNQLTNGLSGRSRSEGDQGPEKRMADGHRQSRVHESSIPPMARPAPSSDMSAHFTEYFVNAPPAWTSEFG